MSIEKAVNEKVLADAFRQSMSMLTASVAVVTTEVAGRPWGTTITACCSVSAFPPSVLISLGESTTTAQAVAEKGEYGLCLMGPEGVEAADFAAAPGRPKFLDEVGCVAPGAGATVSVRGAVAHLDCEVTQAVQAVDHVIFVGRVRDISFPEEGPTLLYGDRTYQRSAPLEEPVARSC